MIGRWVVEVCFFVSMVSYWFYFLFLPDGFWGGVVGLGTALSERDSSSVFFSAITTFFAGVFMLIKNGEEKLAIEVFKPFGLVIFGSSILAFCYVLPLVLFSWYSPGGPGVVSRVINLGVSSSLFLSFLISLSFSLGGLGVYLVGQGVRFVLLSFVGFVRGCK